MNYYRKRYYRQFLIIIILCLSIFSQTDSTSNEKIKEQKPISKKIKINIAILTIKPSGGITKGESELITDRLNIELFKTGQVNMVERNEMSEILKEQGFQQSGACSDDACLVEMGQLLGVQDVISGSLGRLGSLVIINLRMIDVATGKIMRVVSRDVEGELQDVIKLLPNTARELLGLSLIEKSKPIISVSKQNVVKKKITLKPSKNSVMVDIRTIPDKASLFLNGIEVGKTPFIDNSLLPGKYRLEIKKKNYESYEEIFELTAGNSKKIGRNLIYKFSNLTIISKPKGAEIMLDDKVVGVTPYSNPVLIPDEYRIKLTLKGYRIVDDKYIAQKNFVDTLSYNLFSEEFLEKEKSRKRDENRGSRIARRIIFGTLAATAWGTGIYFNYELNNSLDRENELYNIYLEEPTSEKPIAADEYATRYANYQTAVEESDDYKMYRNIAYGVAGGLSFCFVISIPF